MRHGTKEQVKLKKNKKKTTLMINQGRQGSREKKPVNFNYQNIVSCISDFIKKCINTKMKERMDGWSETSQTEK